MTNGTSRKTRKKKILIFYTDTMATGGAEEYLKKLILHLDREQFDIRIAIPRSRGTENFIKGLISRGVKVDYISKYNIFSILLYFIKIKPDFIHFNLPFPIKCITAQLAAIIHSESKLYVTEHLAPPGYKPNPLMKLIKKFVYSKLDTAITVSNKNKETLIKNFDLPENKIRVVYNCIETTYIKNYNREIAGCLKEKFAINDSALVFGTVGRLDRQKGHEYLINSSKDVIREVPNSIFLFVGEGRMKDQLLQKIKDNNISEYFGLVGYQENLPEILSLIDIFVLPSISEGFPFSVLEAMAAGKPVIATNVGGVPEIITNNVNGILVEPTDSDALSRAMIILAKDEKKRNCLAEMGRKKVIENFSLEKMILTTEEIYRS